MENNASVLSKIMREVRGPRGAKYLIGCGALITVFGCVGITIAGGFLLGTEKETPGYTLAGVLSLLTTCMLCGGGAITIIGGVTSLLRARKGTVDNEGPATIMPAPYPPSPHPAPMQYQPIQPAYIPPSQGLSIEHRQEILQREINKYIRQGYRVISQTNTTAQLVRPKRFSCLWFFINLILLFGWIFYLLWYWSKRDEQIYIEVDINGKTRVRR